MNEAINSYFLFGGSFFTKLLPVLQTRGKIVGQMTGVSPLSEVSLSAQEDQHDLTYWLPELDAELAACQPGYFVLDLQLALTNLLASDAGFISASPENLERLTRTEIAVVDPILLPWEEVDASLNRLASVIAGHVTPRRIILIHAHNSPYWLAGNNLRSEGSPAADAAHAKWLKELEQRFCEITGCHFVDVTRFYFYQKEVGKPLTNVIFEKECYRDVANRIFAIAEGSDSKAERPDFAFSLQRYAAYYFTLQRKPQRVFLDANYFLDRLVLSASGDFVKQYREALIDLDALDWHDPRKALNTLNKLAPDSVVTKVCVAFYAVVNGIYTDPRVDYGLMFRCEVVPDVLITHLKKEYAPNAKLLPVQITRYNAGYHFARMLGLDPAPFSTEKTVAEPVVIDIFGSCISRTLFNVRDHDFAVNNYWFHVPPFEFRNQPVEVSASLFPEKLSWTDRLVKQQLACGVYQKIRESGGQWLVLDLYALISPNNFYYQDCLFGDFDHRISTCLKAKRVSFVNGTNPIGSQDDVIAALDPWLEVIKKKYGRKIILIEGQRLQHWIGDDDCIYRLTKSFDCNDFLRRASDYLVEKTGCYSVDIGNFFLPDELGFMRNTPAHKEDLCYFASHDIVRHIVDAMPEQKRFDRVPGHVHMTHLERLAKGNSLSAMEKALPLSALDRAAIRLGYEGMKKWHDPLAEIFDQSDRTMTLEQILSTSVTDPSLAAALCTAAKTASDSGQKTKTAYPGYSENEGIMSGVNGNCTLPKFPGLTFKRILCDKGVVSIDWSAPKAECVRIYRWSRESSWILVGKSGNNTFTDSTVRPRTEYRYSLCAEVWQEKRCFLGSFTAPQRVTTAVGTPVLVSAVHMAGFNTLRWMGVAGAEHYRIYRKDSLNARWELRCTVEASGQTCFTERSKFPAGGEWYTVRAVGTVDGVSLAGGFQSGLCACML